MLRAAAVIAALRFDDIHSAWITRIHGMSGLRRKPRTAWTYQGYSRMACCRSGMDILYNFYCAPSQYLLFRLCRDSAGAPHSSCGKAEGTMGQQSEKITPNKNAALHGKAAFLSRGKTRRCCRQTRMANRWKRPAPPRQLFPQERKAGRLHCATMPREPFSLSGHGLPTCI